MEMLVWHRVVSSDIVEPRHASFASEFMNKFALPEKHNMLLVLGCFLNFSSVELACLFLLDFEDLSKSSTAKLFDNFEARLQNFLALLKHVVLH